MRLVLTVDEPDDRRLVYVFEPATVSRVIDGDTLVLTNGERVRLIGIDAPEMGRFGAREGAEPGAVESKYFVKMRLEQHGHRVYLQTSGSDRDRFERLRRYVWLGLPSDPANQRHELLLNQLLLDYGHAVIWRN